MNGLKIEAEGGVALDLYLTALQIGQMTEIVGAGVIKGVN
jgi:hypothetical protein